MYATEISSLRSSVEHQQAQSIIQRVSKAESLLVFQTQRITLSHSAQIHHRQADSSYKLSDKALLFTHLFVGRTGRPPLPLLIFGYSNIWATGERAIEGAIGSPALWLLKPAFGVLFIYLQNGRRQRFLNIFSRLGFLDGVLAATIMVLCNHSGPQKICCAT